MINAVLFSLAAGLVLVWYYRYTLLCPQKKTTHPQYPNGPIPLPFVGNIWTIHKLNVDAEKTCRSLGSKYKDLCMLWYGSSPALLVNSPQAAHDLLHQMSISTASRPDHNSFRYTISPGKLVMTPCGETFRLLRKTYHTLLSPRQSSSFHTYQDQESKVLLQSLLDTPHGFLKATERFALSVIFSAVYGVRLATLDHPIIVEFYQIWNTLLLYFLPGTCPFDIFPFLLKLPLWLQPWHRLADRLTKREAVLHRKFLKNLKYEFSEGYAPDCFGRTLLELQDSQTVDDEQAMNILAMLIGAGSDTTSSVLQTFFKVMALHPSAVQMAQQELDKVVGPDRLPSWKDEKNLPYLRALIKEVHRWAPIGNLGVPHATTENITYRNWHIPKGTIIFPNLTTLSENPDRYLEPEKFEPRRHIADNLDASASALNPDWTQRDHFHYGFGRRLCQGIFVAESSLYISIARILWAFDIQQVPGCSLDMSSKIGGLVTKPKPFTVIIKSRSTAYETVVRREAATMKMSLFSLEDERF
ncbi:cytochrome P450 [Triangularia verruculosa]|uniref:Cytochrome P450 n=1 Tax=Triangularia verruculosa TaxID=2587418 RepID=A0AAN6XNG1_9PEZI|nr:cytochrome P450 [Triangularia verruculosa]